MQQLKWGQGADMEEDEDERGGARPKVESIVLSSEERVRSHFRVLIEWGLE